MYAKENTIKLFFEKGTDKVIELNMKLLQTLYKNGDID